MAVTVGDITGNADLFRKAYPNWPHPEPAGEAVWLYPPDKPGCVICHQDHAITPETHPELDWPHPEPEEAPVDTAFRNVDPSCVCCLPSAQERALRDLCARYNVGYDPDHYKPAFGLPKGYVSGWVGGYGIQKSHPTICVGCSPEGAISS